MSDTIIQVENLGKKYIIGHQQANRSGEYTTLRDLIANGARSIWNRLNPLTQNSKLKTQNSTKEEFWALKDVSFEVKQGEVIGIIGRNGAGKSTLLKILSRITEPTEGRVKIRGRVASLLEVGTGFHPELTGRENIYLNGAILGMTRAEIQRKFDEIVDFAEVEKFLDTPVKHYSSGMYVRLAFAVAAHLEPEILVVDEVLAVGDAAFQKKCLGKMGDVATREGRTVLFVSHNMSALSSFCTQACLLSYGKLLNKGDTNQIINQYLEITKTINYVPLKDRKDRSGDGTTQFTKIEIKTNNPNNIIFSNSHIDILLSYCGKKSLRNVTFAIGVFDYSGVEIYFLDSNSNSQLPCILPCEGQIKCSLGALNISPGQCYLNIALVKGGVIAGGSMLDYVQSALSFSVESSDCYGYTNLPSRNWSVCIIPHKWSIEKTS